jgi:hypothetical protein
MKGRRQRSSSIVSNIAFNVPILDQFEQLKPESESQHFHNHGRSHSFSLLSSKSVNNLQENYIITPLLKDEKSEVWNHLQQSNENNIDFDLIDEIVIENLESNISNNQSVLKTTDFLNILNHTKTQNDSFIQDVENIIHQLDSLLSIHNNVTIQTRDFQSESNQLIQELNVVESLYSELSEKFDYFKDLDSIVKKLNTVNNSKIVLKSSFHDNILIKLDNCIKFVNNPKYENYKDITMYKYRFKQCMIRALTLIRNYIINFIKNVESKIISKINELPKENSNSIVIDALINNNFLDNMSSIYNLFSEIYKRTNGNDDYFNLLDDVYNQYFKTRGNLINNYIISPQMKNINFNLNLIDLSNSNLKFFMKLIDKEFEIFKSLFFLPPNEINELIDNSTNLTVCYKFFESTILDHLYYLLRNKILRETNINSLCELITLINSYSESENLNFEFSQYLNLQLNRINYEELLKPILEDAQTRLVFRIQKYVETNIVNYKKTGKELIITNKPVKSSDDDKNDFINNNLVLNSNMVYPPIICSIKLLTKIYQLLNQSIFDDITSSVVHLSLLSLKNNFNNNSTLDCKLYQIRSLILFKEYINTFDIEHARKETVLDFSGLQNLYSKFLGRQNKIELKSTDHESLFNTILGSIPKVINDYVDCRIELQIEIRNVVHEFIEISSKNFIEPLLIDSTDSLNVESLNKINEKFIFNIKTELPRLKILIQDYIKDNKTKIFLLDGIKEEIQAEYSKFYKMINESNNGELIAELMDNDEIIKIWADTVKLLFINDDDEDRENEQNLNELKDIQKDLENMDVRSLDADSVVTSTISK